MCRAIRDGGRDAARITTLVAALVVVAGDAGHPGERGDATEHTIRVVRVESDALPLGGRERPRLFEDAIGDADDAKIVEQRRAPELFGEAGIEAVLRRGGDHQSRDSG